jgi:hypothetical protein
MRAVELGAVEPYADGHDPSFPAINLVYLPHKRFSDVFPAECAQPKVWDVRPLVLACMRCRFLARCAAVRVSHTQTVLLSGAM